MPCCLFEVTMKAIILTYAPVSKEDAKLLKNTDIFKIATNYSASELKPNLRLTADNIVDKCLECDTCDVVSVNYDLERDRVINACYLPKRHSSLLSCVDYLYLQGYTSVLLVASNPPDTATYKINREGIDDMKDCLYLYKYTNEGCFDIPQMTIKEFIMLSDEEKLLGVTDERPKRMIEKTVFSDSCMYEVCLKGRNNKSIENGKTINTILTYEQKQKFLYGADEIEVDNLVIKKITKLVPDKKKEVKKEIDFDKMSYNELVKYAKEHNIKSKTSKKADLIEAIKEQQ